MTNKTLLQTYQQEAYIIHTRHTSRRDDSPKIIATLLAMKSRHLAEHSIKLVEYRLCELSERCILSIPKNVEDYIDTKTKADGKKTSEAYKNALLKAYYQFTKTNNIDWKPKFYRVQRAEPLLPTQKEVDTIINSCKLRYKTIFTILDDTGAEGKELEMVNAYKEIDRDQGIISFKGCKMHNPRTIKLKPLTRHLLNQYLDKFTDEYPFPPSRYYGEVWAKRKKALAKLLNMPELLKTDVRHIRHFSASKFYQQTGSELQTNKRLGHKKWETTRLYVQILAPAEDKQYDSKAVKDEDVRTALQLASEGWQEFSRLIGYVIYRKRK